MSCGGGTFPPSLTNYETQSKQLQFCAPQDNDDTSLTGLCDGQKQRDVRTVEKHVPFTLSIVRTQSNLDQVQFQSTEKKKKNEIES